jgi:hypothetical protein
MAATISSTSFSVSGSSSPLTNPFILTNKEEHEVSVAQRLRMHAHLRDGHADHLVHTLAEHIDIHLLPQPLSPVLAVLQIQRVRQVLRVVTERHDVCQARVRVDHDGEEHADGPHARPVLLCERPRALLLHVRARARPKVRVRIGERFRGDGLDEVRRRLLPAEVVPRDEEPDEVCARACGRVAQAEPGRARADDVVKVALGEGAERFERPVLRQVRLVRLALGLVRRPSGCASLVHT